MIMNSSFVTRILEADYIPDIFIRHGIRNLLAQRLREESRSNPELQQAHLMQLVNILRDSPIAINTAEANNQHYELPTNFYRFILGNHLKYSSCHFDKFDITKAAQNLNSAEERMLELTCERARLIDGEKILELGCGWGSLSLWMAMHYPNSKITAVSNSRTQKLYIDAKANECRIQNLEVITCDINKLDFMPNIKFDRVVSVEMFEHTRNYQTLLARIALWMNPKATLFIHIFTHKKYAYTFDIENKSDWMAKFFFTGGIMPSDSLLHYFQEDLTIVDHWRVDGRHYQLTAEAWLANMDAHRFQIMPILASTYGQEYARRWWVYWRIFLMSCAELWGYRNGREWGVSHYLFKI